MNDDQFSAKPRLNKTLASRLIRGFLLCSALTPFPVLAQAASTSDSGPQVEDIVVTAQQRSENLQSGPISVPAIPYDHAAAPGIPRTLAITATEPSLQLQPNSKCGSNYMRGVGSNPKIGK